MPHKVFWCEPTGSANYYYRRYKYKEGERCNEKDTYHNACTFWYKGNVIYSTDKKDGHRYIDSIAPPALGNWPVKCENCDYIFSEEDDKQIFMLQIYRRTDTNEEIEDRSWPIGAMRDLWWMWDAYKGADGLCVCIQTPDGEWIIDSRASNCTLKQDNVHKCWVRHGDPKTGDLHVDKSGVTCSAGGGSIQCGNYHGFLHNGYLTD